MTVCTSTVLKFRNELGFLVPSAPSAPRNVTTVSIVGSSVTLNWLPPLTPNGVVRFYMVSLIFVEATIPQNTSNTNLVVNGVPLGRAFNVTVRAFTVAFGEASSVVTVRVRKCGVLCA